MLNQQGQQNPHPSPNSNLNSSSNQSSVQFDQSHMMTELLDKQHQEHQKEMFSLHRLLKNLQQGAVANPGQVVPVENLPSLIAPQEATTTTINTPTTPIPTNNSSSVVHPEPSPAPAPAPQPTTTTTNSQTNQSQQTKDEWQSVAELLYSKRSNNHLNNYEHVTEILAANPSLFEPLLERCPNIGLIIAHLLKLRFGLTVQKVSWTSSISDWNGEDCRRVGCSVAAFLRNFQTGEAALEAWKLNYVQVSEYRNKYASKILNFQQFIFASLGAADAPVERDRGFLPFHARSVQQPSARLKIRDGVSCRSRRLALNHGRHHGPLHAVHVLAFRV